MGNIYYPNHYKHSFPIYFKFIIFSINTLTIYYKFPDETKLEQTGNILARRTKKYPNGLEQ